jgi:hypothetical protein
MDEVHRGQFYCLVQLELLMRVDIPVKKTFVSIRVAKSPAGMNQVSDRGDNDEDFDFDFDDEILQQRPKSEKLVCSTSHPPGE